MFTGMAPLATGYALIAQVAPNYAYLDPIVHRMIQQSPAERPHSVARLKEELLASGNEFIALQRLDAAKHTVLAAFEPNDPLGGENVKVMGVDYKPGALIVTLDPSPNPQWIEALHNLGAFTSIVGGASPALARLRLGILRFERFEGVVHFP